MNEYRHISHRITAGFACAAWDERAAAIAEIGQRIYQQGLIVAGDGNISVRLAADQIMITPAGLCKGRLHPRDMVIIDLDDQLLASPAGHRPSSERRLHLLTYRARPAVQAIVHAHPPTAVAATLAGVSMHTEWLPETILTLGAIPTAPYALTGTTEMFDAVAPYLADHNALLLSHHGALTMGTTLEQAFMRMEQVEHSAKILLAAHQFGGVQPLPPERIAQLRALREQTTGCA
jgi:L-fuculose-phosphate aldolase